MSTVDDQYWLEYSKKSIEGTISSINEAAAKLEKMVLWFWGLYTAAFTIGVTINAISAPTHVLILLASPIAALIISYWMCNWVQLPLFSKFDPRIPEEIKNSFNRAAQIKTRRLNRTLMVTFISAALLSYALSQLAFVKKKDSVQTEFLFDKVRNRVIISGKLPSNTIVNVKADTNGVSLKPYFETSTTVFDDGCYSFVIPIVHGNKFLNTTVFWSNGDSTHSTVSRIIQLK